MENVNVAVVERSIDALNARDFDGVMACFTDDVVFDGSRVMEGTYEGKARYRAFLEEAVERVDFRHEAVSILSDGERVIALADVSGQGSASGVALEGRIAYVYEIRDGLITRQEIHRDVEGLLESLGIEE